MKNILDFTRSQAFKDLLLKFIDDVAHDITIKDDVLNGKSDDYVKGVDFAFKRICETIDKIK